MNIENLTLAEIVSARPSASQLFENYDLDFCCGGNRKLAEALRNNTVGLSEITTQLEQMFKSSREEENDFNKMSLTELSYYILENHHSYVKENLPIIQQYLEKICDKHGETFPEMKKIKSLFEELKRDLEQHMIKEEIILFPKIREMETLLQNESSQENMNLEDPVHVMTYEHETAHQILTQIKCLSSNYTVHENACTTFRLCLDELKTFESNLRQHVHLENNILFPKAIMMQEKRGSVLLNHNINWVWRNK